MSWSSVPLVALLYCVWSCYLSHLAQAYPALLPLVALPVTFGPGLPSKCCHRFCILITSVPIFCILITSVPIWGSFTTSMFFKEKVFFISGDFLLFLRLSSRLETVHAWHFCTRNCTLNCVNFFRYRATNLGAW